MKPEFIKEPFQVRPIPKYITAKIRRRDKENCPEQKGPCRFYSYLTAVRRDPVKITVAVKNYKKRWYIKQVAAHGVKSNMCLVKDMEYNYIGMGFRVGWYAEGAQKHKKWFEDGKWYDAKFKYYNPYTVTVNPEYIGRFPEYRYSAYKEFRGVCIINYLRLYEQYPQVEYLVKLGLHNIHDSVTVLKRIAKDKRFCKWLIAHKTEIASQDCYVGAIMQAYIRGKPIKQVQAFAECKKKLDRDNNLRPLKELFGKDRDQRSDLERFFLYLETQDSSPSAYLDYLKACNYLGLDMSLPKNRFPHDFKRWHDIRIDEYHTAKATADENERAELYKQFAAVAQKYMSLQKTKAGKGPFQGYAMVIAASPAELVREGDILHHCVGKMGYDQRMAREESLIFFVRNTSAPDVPFITVEYSPKTKKVLQCYGEKNTKPDDNVMAFINKTWLPYASRTLNKLNQKIAV